MKRILLYIWPIIVIASCDTNETIENSSRQLVVQGWLTDMDTNQYVKISQTQSFNDQTDPETINNAIVRVVSANRSDSFRHVGEGLYRSRDPFIGEANTSYQLVITLNDGREIISTSEVMPQAPSIDSLIYDSYEQPSEEDPDVIENIYFPNAKIKDEAGVDNYYRWRLFKNDSLFAGPEYMVLTNDQFFDGNEPLIANEFTIFQYALGDSIGIEFMEISQDAFNFLRLLKTQTTTIGTVSSVTPAPIIGNLRFRNENTEVLGFWGVASVQRAGIKISQ